MEASRGARRPRAETVSASVLGMGLGKLPSESMSRSVMFNSLHPMDCSPPGFSVHGILQARVLKRVAISFSRGSFQARDQTQVSRIAGKFSTV